MYDAQLAIAAVLLFLGIVEFVIGILAAVCCCMMRPCACCALQQVSTPQNHPHSTLHSPIRHLKRRRAKFLPAFAH